MHSIIKLNTHWVKESCYFDYYAAAFLKACTAIKIVFLYTEEKWFLQFCSCAYSDEGCSMVPKIIAFLDSENVQLDFGIHCWVQILVANTEFHSVSTRSRVAKNSRNSTTKSNSTTGIYTSYSIITYWNGDV